MRSRPLPCAALQATALLSFLGGGAALRAQPSSDLRWDRQGTTTHTIQSRLLTTISGGGAGNGANDTENDEVGDPDIAGVQTLHYFTDSAPGGTGAAGGGTGGTGFGEVYSYAAGIAELNPDEQPLLSWSVIHDQISYTDLEGGGGGGGGNGTWGNPGNACISSVGWNRLISGIGCNALLEVVPMGNPSATTQGTIEVNLAWTHVDVPDAEIPGPTGAGPGGSGSLPWDRPVGMFVSVGDAALSITGGGASAMQIVYQGDTDPFPVVVNGAGFADGTAGTMFLGRGNCVDTTMAAGATASMSGTMESRFGAAGNGQAGGGGSGFPGAPPPDGGDGGGAAGGSAGTNGSPGGAGDHAEYTTQGMFESWIGVFAGW